MSQLLIERPELTLDPEGLGPEDELRLHGALGELAAVLARALAEPPAADAGLARAAEEILAALAALDGCFTEINFIAATEDARSALNVEGVFVEPVPLLECAKSLAQREAAGKLVDFFHARQLLCLTLRRETTAAQLTGFLRIAGAAPASARSSDGLVAAGVVTISAVDREDLIAVKQGLAWRSRLALSRLAEGLRDAHLYVAASGREPQHVLAALLRETIHPLRSEQLLTELLLNADLARATTGDLQRADVQGDVVTVLTAQQAQTVTGYLARQLSATEASNADFTWRERGLRLLHRLLPRLGDLLDDVAVATLRLVVEQGLVAGDALPAHLRDALDPEKLTTAFLGNPDPSLERLRGLRDLEHYRQFGSSFAAITSELIRRRQYAWARKVADGLAELAKPASAAAPRVRQLATKAIAANATAAVLERMAGHLPRLPADERGELLGLLGHFGAPAAALLIRCLHDHRHESLRPSLRAMLASLGATALPLLTRAVQNQQLPPDVRRELLLVLTTVHDPSTYALVAGFTAAEHPMVRQAALQAIARIDVGRAEPELIKAMADPSVNVRVVAIEGLGAIGSRNRAFLTFLYELFEGKLQPTVSALTHKGAAHEVASELSAHYQLLTAGCAAVASLAQRRRLDLSDLEEPIMRSLKKLDGGLVGLALRLVGKGAALDRVEELRNGSAIALVTALAWVGSDNCIPVLEHACKHPDPRVQDLAVRAIEAIKARNQ